MRTRPLVLTLSIAALALASCGGGGGGGGSDGGDECDGGCSRRSLSSEEVRALISRGVVAAQQIGSAATISIVDRVGNVLALYQMNGAAVTANIQGGIQASGGLEGSDVPATFAAISKAGTGAFLSSQGNAFSTRTASQIVQEHFQPGRALTPGGPLFGVQFSQLPCGDLLSATGGAGPRPLPLGLSADPGGIPLYRDGDVVGGIGVEIDGVYRLDRDVFNLDSDVEELVALTAAQGFEAPSERRAERIVAGGQSLRFIDANYGELTVPEIAPDLSTTGSFPALAPFTDGSIRAGALLGNADSGIVETSRVGVAAGVLSNLDGSPRYPTRPGTALPGGAELTGQEVDAILDSALLTADRLRAAIRRPLDTAARVSIFVVDTEGIPLGFVRSQDAPIFGIDVSLQKARTAAFFSSRDAADKLAQLSGRYVVTIRNLLGSTSLANGIAVTARAVGNIARPFFPDGVDGNSPGPFSLPFPSPGAASPTWSPFNTGLQFDLIRTRLLAALGGQFGPTCVDSAIVGRRLGNGIQIFPGGVPLFRGSTLIGTIGVSGDGIDQDDTVAFFGASRRGLDFAGHPAIGDSVLGFNAPRELRIDQQELSVEGVNLRYVNCPEGPFRGDDAQNICDN